jgi:hypothetical protein
VGPRSKSWASSPDGRAGKLEVSRSGSESRKSRSGSSDSRNHALPNLTLTCLTLTCLTLTGAAPPFKDEPPAGAKAGVRAAPPERARMRSSSWASRWRWIRRWKALCSRTHVSAGARAPGLRVGGGLGGGRPCARAPTSPPTAGALKARPSSRESLKHGSPTLEIRVRSG